LYGEVRKNQRTPRMTATPPFLVTHRPRVSKEKLQPPISFVSEFCLGLCPFQMKGSHKDAARRVVKLTRHRFEISYCLSNPYGNAIYSQEPSLIHLLHEPSSSNLAAGGLIWGCGSAKCILPSSSYTISLIFALLK
jgi:hypothetical protein